MQTNDSIAILTSVALGGSYPPMCNRVAISATVLGAHMPQSSTSAMNATGWCIVILTRCIFILTPCSFARAVPDALVGDLSYNNIYV